MKTKELGALLVHSVSHDDTICRVLPHEVEMRRVVTPVVISRCGLLCRGNGGGSFRFLCSTFLSFFLGKKHMYIGY